jgi:Hint domain
MCTCGAAGQHRMILDRNAKSVSAELKSAETELTNHQEDLGAQRTRRNIMKIGAILSFAALQNVSKTDPASANCGNDKPVGNGCRSGNAQNCFLKGTTIRTVTGERKIEDLAIGDLVPTMFSGLRPVQWIGRYSVQKSGPSNGWVKDALPVRIARSAFALDLPHADLYVTASHSLLIDGVLVPAEALINGATITRYEPEGDKLEFLHVKLESHDVVYAEGVPAETLLYVDESFVNFADYLRRYGMPMPTPEGARCAPVVRIGGREELKSRFRSALSPWIDFRNQADVVRDRVEERGFVDSRQFETVC